MLAGTHLGGLGCGPLAAAYALLPTVVSASRPAMASDNSFFFTMFSSLQEDRVGMLPPPDGR